MKKVMFILLCVAIFASLAMAQVTYTKSTGTPIGATTPIDKLGAHNNGGRGCTGCHAPHSGAAGAGGNAGSGTTVDTTNAGNDALWGQDLGPLYGYTLNMGDNGSYVETLPASTAFAVGNDEIRGIMMCLSCHDGNIAKGAMMTNQSWEQKAGLLPATYGTKPIPTLLGNDGTAAGNYNNDHPVGQAATLGALGVASRFTVTAGKYTTTDAQYLEFITNYGMPTISKVKLPSGFVDGSAPTNAYVVCTTCHTPHTMYTSSASSSNKIAGLSSGVFPSFFFIAAPYNPSSTPTPSQASSATQFCRQCHFTGAGGSNEGSNIHGVTTAF